jgi:predicted enzyme related to lactoylglutathione lyase
MAQRRKEKTMGSTRSKGHAIPRLNLVVIRSSDLDRAESFYGTIGLSIERHAHGKGPIHLASENDRLVFEIYPKDADQASFAMRIGFEVSDVDDTVAKLNHLGGIIRNEPKDGPWGRRAVVEDFDGNIIELTHPLN